MYNIFICLVQNFTIVTEDKKTLTQIEVNIINYLSRKNSIQKNTFIPTRVIK